MRPRGHWVTSRLYGQKGLTRGGRRGDRGRGSVRRQSGVKMGRNLMVGKGLDWGMGEGGEEGTYIDRTSDAVDLSQAFQLWA